MKQSLSFAAYVAVGAALLSLLACDDVETPSPEPSADSDIVRYTGPDSDMTGIHRHEYGASYSSPPEVMNAIEVGMTIQEVSEILTADFSPSRGIMFRHDTRETYLHVELEDGRVLSSAAATTGFAWVFANDGSQYVKIRSRS